jgi:hypothetical protein
VPLAMPFGRYCPFLLGSDLVSLSNNAKLEGSLLQDAALGATHTVNGPGTHILAALNNGISVDELDTIATKHALHNGQLAELLGFLNLAGILLRRRTPYRWPEAIARQGWHLCLNIRYAPLAWRQPANFASLASAILRATSVVTAATMLVSILMIVAGLPVLTTISHSLLGLFIFICSLYVHEATHVLIIKRHGHVPVVLQRGLRLGILHTTLPARNEVICSLAGPLAGMTSALSASAVAFAIPYPTHGLLALIVSGFHALSLLPWYGDGASIRQVLQQRRSS